MLRLDFGQIEVLDDELAEVLRKKTSAERLRIGASMWKASRAFLARVLRRAHPDWKAERIEQEIHRRFAHGPH